MQTIISENIQYIGVDDTTLDLFENQYPVPEGVSYNSYVILDEMVALLDTVDKRGQKEWEEKLLQTLNGRKVDFLIIHHMEPDHAGSIARIVELFPEVVLVGSVKTFAMLPQYFQLPLEVHTLTVKEGDKLALGEHTLTFFMAPMVHWPEVMVSYEKREKVLFSADAFGKFGALSLTEQVGWACEARRYYFNIVGKYGAAVQTLLKKLEGLELQWICPLHGPMIKEGLQNYVNLYKIWSSYAPESTGVVIVYATMHGNTGEVARTLAVKLQEQGVRIRLHDLTREDMSQILTDAFRYDRLVLAAASYDGGVCLSMLDFLHHLQSKAYQNRRVALMENGSWSPCAAKTMRTILETMKDIEILEPTVTIHSTLKESDLQTLDQLVEVLLECGK
ncbi:MAG: FprA family A-type flavoprotein [Lachnospiraceae bacterium]|nr:FprA family A-type flavoprotein [Lachnospiraceae bacterium]